MTSEPLFNYLLTENDIWDEIWNTFPTASVMLELKFQNDTTGEELPILKLYPSPDDRYLYNLCIPIRALMPEPDHINNNSLQHIIGYAKMYFDDGTDMTVGFDKYFVRGGLNKDGNAEWHLEPDSPLVVGRWLVWDGITLPGFAQRIQSTEIVSFVPSNPFKMPVHRNCDYKIVKFLNSLGGYQFYVFERHEFRNRSKGNKTIDRATKRLRRDNFRNLEVEAERTIRLMTKTPLEAQDVIMDLISSQEVLLYNHLGADNDAKWERLKIESNESVKNNFNRVYQNEIEFSFSKYVTRKL